MTQIEWPYLGDEDYSPSTKEYSSSEVFDSTKINNYMECPRAFFYRHVLNWAPEGLSVHLAFGLAWHKALEHIWQYGYPECLEEADDIFRETYELEFGSNWTGYEPKTPPVARNALDMYRRLWSDDHRKWEVLFIEVPGCCFIPTQWGEFPCFYKQDLVLRSRQDNKVWVMDHKTASRDSLGFREQWKLSFQMGMYLHALYSIYQPSEVGGCIIDAAFIRKSSLDFDRIPVPMGPEHMQRWLAQASGCVEAILRDYKQLELESPSYNTPMTSFRQNTTNCCKYGLCPYFDFCAHWTNPLARCDETPVGFKTKVWDPRDRMENK